MGAQVVFRCDHEGCEVTFTLDSEGEHECGKSDRDVPLDLSPVVRFLTDDPKRGGKGWEFALVRLPPTPRGMPALMLVKKCFCSEHGDDLKTMPEYKPDAAAQRHARRTGVHKAPVRH